MLAAFFSMPDFDQGQGKRRIEVSPRGDFHSRACIAVNSFVPWHGGRPTNTDTPLLAQKAPQQRQYIGNERCAGCHSEIYKSYLSTAMAQASGPATQNLITGEFQHKPSGVHYRVYRGKRRRVVEF